MFFHICSVDSGFANKAPSWNRRALFHLHCECCCFLSVIEPAEGSPIKDSLIVYVATQWISRAYGRPSTVRIANGYVHEPESRWMAALLLRDWQCIWTSRRPLEATTKISMAITSERMPQWFLFCIGWVLYRTMYLSQLGPYSSCDGVPSLQMLLTLRNTCGDNNHVQNQGCHERINKWSL